MMDIIIFVHCLCQIQAPAHIQHGGVVFEHIVFMVDVIVGFQAHLRVVPAVEAVPKQGNALMLCLCHGRLSLQGRIQLRQQLLVVGVYEAR